MGKIPQIHQKVYNSIHNYPLGLNSTSFNAKFRLEKFRLFTMWQYLRFKGLDYYSQFLQYTKYINTLTLLSDSPYAWKTSYWIQILKLETLNYFWFIPSHYLEFVNNYNEEKVIIIIKTFPLFQRQCLLIPH